MPAAATPAPAVYCYSGPGAGTRSVLSTLHSLREALVPAVKVASLDASQLLSGGWQEGCLLLVMPGGADLPYCKKLNGAGNALIREYVEGGGSYLGLCAGAYYASARVEFEPGTRLEVVGDRELAFFPGKAVGSIYRGFQYESEDGALAAPLHFCCLDGLDGSGDGLAAEQQQQRQQGHAAHAARSGGNSSSKPSSSSGGSGGGIAAAGEWQEAVDYVNGGPTFTLLDGSPVPLLEQAAAPGCRQQQQQQHSQAVQVLATYPDHRHAAAALLCSVGSRGGRAVLCGSHPELDPSWLGGKRPPVDHGGLTSSGRPAAARTLTAAAPGGQRAAFVDTVSNRAAAACALAASWSTAEHVERLQAALLQGRRQRWRFWRSLLVAAGLRPWMHPRGSW